MNIGENIKKLRIEKGLTRQDLAKALKVSDSTISRYENNKREPNMETINKIAKALEVSPSEFFDWDNLNEKETHLLISEITGDRSSFSQLESKISYSLISIFEFAKDLYGEDLFINDIKDFIDSEDYFELFMNITDLIENKINKLISLKKKNDNK